ncbi:DUF5723 family protein [Flavobacterium sp.]|uniref:DUF5723 family protein n=1 Tax=Flavobacterium sp. TaxID=239 RepID=UPI0025E3B84A|nr:DUF5723 family protein [Flavobacterium sp.]
MRKVVFLFCLFVVTNLTAQNKQLLYNFTDIPQSLMTNPGADVKYKWYVGVPFLSGISMNVGSTGFSAYDLFANDGVDFNTKLRSVLSKTTHNDVLSLNQQLELFSGGFRIGTEDNRSYLSFGLYQEFDFLSYVPQDIATLAIDGNKNYMGKRFNLADLSAKADLLSVFHIGIHKKIQDNLIVGARAKIYSSIFNASSVDNAGYIYTNTSTDSYYEQIVYSNLQLNTSGFAQYNDANNTSNAGADIKKGILLGGNLGLGLDLGLTYYPQSNVQFTASVIDLGYISHTKEVESYSYKGFYNYKGLVPHFNNENAAQANYQDFKNAIVLDTLHTKYTTWRPTKFNASAQYSFEEERVVDGSCNCEGTDPSIFYKSTVGAQLFAMTTPKSPLYALTAFYKRNFSRSFQMKATYTADSFSFTNLGLGMSTKVGPVNFYVLADNLLSYTDVSKANSLSFQLGLNVIFKE